MGAGAALDRSCSAGHGIRKRTCAELGRSLSDHHRDRADHHKDHFFAALPAEGRDKSPADCGMADDFSNRRSFHHVLAEDASFPYKNERPEQV